MKSLLLNRRLRAILGLSVALTCLLGSAIGAAASEGPVADAPLPERVLFIGNSHTEQHGGLDWLISNMVAGEDPSQPFEATRLTQNGQTLEYHYLNGAPQAIREGGFDTVVLQGYLPGAEMRTADSFHQYSRRLYEEIQAAGARTVLFMTWPQDRLEWSWAGMDEFVSAFRQAESELGVPVAPVGVAFARAEAERPDLVLIGEDGVHATWEGAYLTAVTVYATLFDRDPVGLDWAFGVSDEDAAFLQRIAAEAVSDWQAGIPTAG